MTHFRRPRDSAQTESLEKQTRREADSISGQKGWVTEVCFMEGTWSSRLEEGPKASGPRRQNGWRGDETLRREVHLGAMSDTKCGTQRDISKDFLPHRGKVLA